MKKFFEEFKAFALKGNMMDMAIGVIIGGAFSTLVTSLTDNLISPILGILGKVNFDAMMWDVFGDGKLVFKYGAFITSVINFLIMALVLFLIVKGMNKLMDLGKHKEEAPAEPEAPAAPTHAPSHFHSYGLSQNYRSCGSLFLPLFSCPARVSTSPPLCLSLEDALSISSSSKRGHSQI